MVWWSQSSSFVWGLRWYVWRADVLILDKNGTQIIRGHFMRTLISEIKICQIHSCTLVNDFSGGLPLVSFSCSLKNVRLMYQERLERY
jgi:hypothetical protein